MSNLPKRLKIGAFVCRVREVKGLTDAGSLSNNTILIDADLPLEQKWETMLHEVIHKINTELKETTVEFLAQALFQVLHDNTR